MISAKVNADIIYTFDVPGQLTGNCQWTSVSPKKDLKYGITASGTYFRYEGSSYYRLLVANETIFDHPLLKISDPLPKDLFITPQGIQELFTLSTGDLDNQDLAQYLTLTIHNAVQYDYGAGSNALGEVTLTDGTTQHLLTAEMTDRYQTPGTQVTVIISLAQEGKLLVKFGEADAGEEVRMEDLELYFLTHGLALAGDTQYIVTWDFGEGYEIESGDDYLLQIPVEPKDSFQILSTDWPIFRGAATSATPSEYDDRSVPVTTNTATVEENETDNYKISCSGVYYYKDYAIGKFGQKSSVQNGDVLSYSIQVYQNKGSPRDAGLPVTEVVSGTQCVLAPVLENSKQPWAQNENIEIFVDSDGTEYYLLELPENDEDGRYVYNGVWFNGNYADSVTVIARDRLFDWEEIKYRHDDYSDVGNVLADDGYVTEIRWYLSASEDYSRTLKFSVLADVAYSLNENAMSGSVCNISYLNDRDGHRLFCATGSTDVHTIDGSKELRDNNGQILAGKTSTISAGETVHYRLTINNRLSREVKIATSDLEDILPATYGVFAWNKENVKLSYALRSNTSVADFPWTITYDEVNGTYEINWLEELAIPAKDTLYIYVDLTFPADSGGDGSLWQQYATKVQNGTLVNAFRLISETYSVSHTLPLPGSAYIQTGVRYSYHLKPGHVHGVPNKDLRYYTVNSSFDEPTMEEIFYVLLYNDGSGPLYLTELQSIFEEKTLGTLRVVESITDRDAFENLPQELSLVQASITVEETGNTLVFTFGSSSAVAGIPTVSYDANVGAYYLEPQQALAFSYRTYIEKRTDTDWNNTIAMPLYDPNNAGVDVAQIPQIRNDYQMYGKIGNDGTCSHWTAAEGENGGYVSQYADEGWVSSSVTLRTETVAGLEKQVVNKRSTTGKVSSYDGSAGPTDSLQWELTVYNDGTNIIENFGIMDLLPYRYGLDVGDVVISDADGSSIRLFTIKELETEGERITKVILNDKTGDHTVMVNGTPVLGDGYSFALQYVESGQLSIALAFLGWDNLSGIIWPGENIKITFWTKNHTQVNTSASYVNNAIYVPLQEVELDKAIHGRVLQDESGRPMGILARGLAVVSNGYATGSEKKVTEKDTTNTASSTQNGTITLTQTGDGYSHFVYELRVDNNANGAKGMNWITLIDNLPQIGDTTTLNQSIPRGSQFQVEFAENPDVKVWYTDQDGTTVNIPNAVIQYSNKTKFTDTDWGTVGSAPSSNDWVDSSAGARSIRIYIPSVDGALAVPAGASLHVSFECQVGADAEPGGTAWNSFGYRYQMSDDNTTLEAAPLEVGVRLPSAPKIQKVLTNKIGDAVTAQKKTDFYFLVYQGEKIPDDFATGADLIQALGNRAFTIVTVTVPEGESQAELKLENLKVCTYTPTSESGWTQTETPWIWKNGENYTVVELGDQLTAGLGSYQDYEFASLAYAPDNSYTFQYSVTTSEEIRAENTFVSRKIQIQKVDQMNQGRKLPNAVFGLYSTDSSDQLMGDALQKAAAEIGLTDEQIQELQGEKLKFTHNGTTYYLYRLGKTDDEGLITWENLPGMSYCYVELWAPEGYYITEKEPVVVSFQQGDEYLYSISHTVTNKEIAYLPKTGGMGRWQIPALGLVLCTAVVTVFLGKRRKKAA